MMQTIWWTENVDELLASVFMICCSASIGKLQGKTRKGECVEGAQ